MNDSIYIYTYTFCKSLNCVANSLRVSPIFVWPNRCLYFGQNQCNFSLHINSVETSLNKNNVSFILFN